MIKVGPMKSFICTLRHQSSPQVKRFEKHYPKSICTTMHFQEEHDQEMQPPVRVYKKPVNWLPFPWHRRQRFNIYESSGDLEKFIVLDPALPKPDFELSDELKTATEEVKQFFSVGNASHADKKEVLRRDMLRRIQLHPFDFDSLEVKIALRTIQIKSLFEHKAGNKRETRFGGVVLPILIQKRNRWLKELRQMDKARFEYVLKELKLYFNPDPMGAKKELYCKKWDLRRLTREYCADKISAKKQAYHEELKQQQESFLKEKEEMLAWIEKEEEALKLL